MSERLKFKRAEDCPDAAEHTDGPRGYIEWHAWAERKAKTHHQVRCQTCGFWAIWVKGAASCGSYQRAREGNDETR